jgi:hypothetical protein
MIVDSIMPATTSAGPAPPALPGLAGRLTGRDREGLDGMEISYGNSRAPAKPLSLVGPFTRAAQFLNNNQVAQSKMMTGPG